MDQHRLDPRNGRYHTDGAVQHGRALHERFATVHELRLAPHQWHLARDLAFGRCSRDPEVLEQARHAGARDREARFVP
jgi:hypothetical protein